MSDKPMYCPLCGAHEFEHGEGKATNEQVLQWRDVIIELHKRLQILEASTK